MSKTFKKPIGLLFIFLIIFSFSSVTALAQTPSIPVTPGLGGNLPGTTVPDGVCYYINKGVPAQTRTTRSQCNGVSTQHEWLSDAQIAAGMKPAIGNDTTMASSTPSQSNCGINPFTCLIDFLLALPGHLSIGILWVAEWLTHISGVVLNFTVIYTVVNMRENISGGTIETAWKTMRDIGNMGFIFVLLYAAIMTIIGQGQDNQKLIMKIVVVAALINFSLFATKMVIDISNIIALTFYDAIAPGALAFNVSQGLSASLMEPLKLGTIYNTVGGLLNGRQLLIIGIAGTILSLIAAFIFFAISIMLVIRFVVLIFTLVLSPIAFLSFVLPGMNKYKDQWWNALSGQAFFAPIYFAMTWIVVVVSKSVLKGGGSLGQIAGVVGADGKVSAPPADAIGMLVNFLIVTAMLVFSLVAAKDWSSKTPGGIGKLTSWATGKAGSLSMGAAGWTGRRFIGGGADAIANNQNLKDRASKGSMIAKLQLAAARKTAGASFDMRATGIGGAVGAGKPTGKGGFTEFKKKKAEEEAKYAASLAPGNEVIDQAEQELEKAKNTYGINSSQAATAQSKLNDLKGVKAKDRRAELDKEKEKELENNPAIKKDEELKEKIKDVEEKLIEAKEADDMTTYQALATELSALNTSKKASEKTAQREKQAIEKDYETRKKAVKDIEGAGNRRKKEYAAAVEASRWARLQGYNTAAAAQIRKGKSAKDKLADAAKELAKEDEATPEPTPAAAPTPPPASGGTPTP
ncbi:hypothetical protein KW807_01505 [Candidatus Parcubacteria bacterium]|nr:hypothetical protein [Candidatus Parcubacteria bacterium]